MCKKNEDKKARTRNITAACLSCALTKLELLKDEEPVLQRCRENLSKAVFLMEEYYQTWHSIRWVSAYHFDIKTADKATKKRTQEKLDQLAFDAYQLFRQATKFLNLYVDVLEARHANGQQVLIPSWWNDMLISLNLADSNFKRENRYQITGKQLSLF